MTNRIYRLLTILDQKIVFQLKRFSGTVLFPDSEYMVNSVVKGDLKAFEVP